MLSIKKPDLTKEEKFAIKQLNRSINRSIFICSYYDSYCLKNWEEFWEKYRKERAKLNGN